MSFDIHERLETTEKLLAQRCKDVDALRAQIARLTKIEAAARNLIECGQYSMAFEKLEEVLKK